MNTVFADKIDKTNNPYLDDMLIHTRPTVEQDGFDTHLAAIEETFRRYQEHHLVVNLKKCVFGQEEVLFAGTILRHNETRMDPKKVAAVQDWPVPSDTTGIRSFISTMGFYRRYIKDFSRIARPLTDLTRGQSGQSNKPITWTAECQTAFERLKAAMASYPVLRVVDPNKPFVLNTDASNVAIGAVLQQEDESGELHPVAYFSQRLTPAEEKYPAHEREGLAVVRSCAHFRPYILRKHVLVRLDNRGIKELFVGPNAGSDRVVRWREYVQAFELEFQHVPGVQNVVADGLSRSGVHTVEASSSDSKEYVVNDELLTQVKNGYANDEFITKIFDAMGDKDTAPSFPRFIRENGILYYMDNGRKLLVIPYDNPLRTLLL
jgi:RNase H-like domain found in reverse transcriptase